MAFGDGIRRNITTVTPEELTRLKNAIIALHTSFHYPGKRDDKLDDGKTPNPGGVTYWFKQDVNAIPTSMNVQLSFHGIGRWLIVLKTYYGNLTHNCRYIIGIGTSP